jgi:hypothetical protein
MTDYEQSHGNDTLNEYTEVYSQLVEYAFSAADELPADRRMAISANVRKPTYAGTTEAARALADDCIASWGEFDSANDVLQLLMTDSLQAAAMIDKVKVDTIGAGGATNGSNAIIMHFIGRLGFAAASELQRFPEEEVYERISSWSGLNNDLLNKDIPKVSWMAFKGMKVAQAVHEAYDLQQELVSRIEQRDEAEADVTLEELRDTNDKLWQELRATQTYGVKPAIAPSLSLGNAKEWLFNNSRDEFKSSDPRTIAATLNSPMATVIGASTHFTKSVISSAVVTYSNANARGQMTHLSQVFEDGDAYAAKHFSFMLNRDGQITTTEGIQLTELAEGYGFELEYEELRSEIMGMFFDLVTPVYVQEVVSQEVKLNPSPIGETSPNGKLRTLSLARIRTLQVLKDDISNVIRKEREEERNKTNLRSLVKHPVVGHIRNLPATFRASDDARELCRKDLGIELSDYGETYVREHERGKVLEKDRKGHRASFEAGRTVVKAEVSGTPWKNKRKR